MAKVHTQFTQDNEYYTPKSIVERFGAFDYDPATTKEKASEFGVENYDTIETDGLSKDWSMHKRIWVNPPFTKKNEFLTKAWETYIKTKNEIYFLVPIGFLTTAQFSKIVGGGKIYVPNWRIAFESGLGKDSKSPAFGSVIIKLQDTFEIEFIKK